MSLPALLSKVMMRHGTREVGVVAMNPAPRSSCHEDVDDLFEQRRIEHSSVCHIELGIDEKTRMVESNREKHLVSIGVIAYLKDLCGHERC